MIDPVDHGKVQGKAQKGQGGRDSKLTKHNKNVTSSLTDRNKEAKMEAEVSKQLSSVEETVFLPWQIRVIELQAQGWSFAKIIEEGEKKRKEIKGNQTWGRNKIILPSRKTLFKATSDQPGFKEACERAFVFAVDAEAQRTIELAKSLDEIAGLEAMNLVNARDKRIQRTMQIAGRIMPDKWGEQAESEREVIVFEPYGGWLPTARATSGDPGQGTEAEEARERWKKMREESKDV